MIQAGDIVGRRKVLRQAPRDTRTGQARFVVLCDCQGAQEQVVYAHSLTKANPALMCGPCGKRVSRETRAQIKSRSTES